MKKSILKYQKGKKFIPITYDMLSPNASYASDNTRVQQFVPISQEQMTRNHINSVPVQHTVSKSKPQSALSKVKSIALNPMTAATYVINKQRIPDNFELGRRSIADYATDVINPAFYINAGKEAVTNTGEGFYNITKGSFAEGFGNLGVAGLNALAIAPVIPKTGQLSKHVLRESVDIFHPIGRKLKQIEKEGIEEGLSLNAIKNRQMQEVGITSLQRKGYFPGVSEILSEYFVPYGYNDATKRLLEIPKKIIKKETNTKRLSELYNVILDQGQNTLSKPRYDAWRMYSGLPQKHGTFRIAETKPINHPSYNNKELKNLEIFSLNNEKALLHHLPNEFDNLRLTLNDDALLNNVDDLKNQLREIKSLKERGIDFPVSDFGSTNVMGGYNRRFFNNLMEYNDIWDLNLNGLKIENYFGKPFMSHGQIEYNTETIEKSLNSLLRRADYLKNKEADININMIKKNKYDDIYQNINVNNLFQNKLKEKKIFSTKQKGGEQNIYWRSGELMVNDPSMDAISKVLLQRNLDKNFMQRAAGFGYQGGIPEKYINGQYPNSNYTSSLLMSSGGNRVFPTIIQTAPQQLSFQPDQREEYLEAPSWDVADYFATKGYKRAANDMYDMEYKNGGYVVRKSNDRKGKTHVVTGPDGTKKYFGDPNMGERSKSKYGKEAFYARHKKNIAKNPYFKAYAKATWQEGGEVNLEKKYLDIVNKALQEIE